jgi:lysozyme
MRTSTQGVELIKHYEGLRLKPYKCPAGIATIGYGSTSYPDGRKVTLVDRPLTEDEADALLAATLQPFEQAVAKMVTVEITQQMFDALVSFAFNLGANALRGNTLLKKLNAGDKAGAAGEFKRWVYAGGNVLPGLVKRRESERKLFLS